MTLRSTVAALAVLAGAVLASGDRSLAAPPDPAPDAPDVRALSERLAPKGWEIASAVFARGVESYAPVAGAWSPKGATADLFALETTMKPKSERAGALYPGLQGLTWDFGTGRRVVESAEILEGAAGPDLEWARIVARHFSDVNANGGWSYVLQVHTRGGRPPSAPPAPSSEAWAAVPFTAYYVFLKPKR